MIKLHIIELLFRNNIIKVLHFVKNINRFKYLLLILEKFIYLNIQILLH